MMTKIATCLLALSIFTACQSTSTTSSERQTLARRVAAQTAPNSNTLAEPAPPAEGPEDVPATRSIDPNRNPSLLPTPLLRANAAGSL